MDETEKAWRAIVVDAMFLALDFNDVREEPNIIICLIESGFSLADIRDHWDEIKARRQH